MARFAVGRRPAGIHRWAGFVLALGVGGCASRPPPDGGVDLERYCIADLSVCAPHETCWPRGAAGYRAHWVCQPLPPDASVVGLPCPQGDTPSCVRGTFCVGIPFEPKPARCAPFCEPDALDSGCPEKTFCLRAVTREGDNWSVCVGPRP